MGQHLRSDLEAASSSQAAVSLDASGFQIANIGSVGAVDDHSILNASEQANITIENLGYVNNHPIRQDQQETKNIKNRLSNKDNCPMISRSKNPGPDKQHPVEFLQSHTKSLDNVDLSQFKEETIQRNQQPPTSTISSNNNKIQEKNINTNNFNFDGRRNLIKNQLYLIEQLQLENANLRNERDHLELENEELKFQLQMINSSNLSDSTSNHLPRHHDHVQHRPTTGCYTAADIQLQKWIQTRWAGERTRFPCDDDPPPDTNINNDITANNSNRQNQQNHWHGKETAHSTVLSSSLLNATFLRRPISRSPGGDKSKTNLSLNNDFLHQPVQNNQATNSENFKRTRLYSSSLSSSAAYNNAPDYHPLNEECMLSPKEQPLTVGASADEEEENERVQMKLVEQRFGDNRDQLRFAAVIIQRAFRRYQICKRFRTITEQLRRNTDCSPKNQQSHNQLSSFVQSKQDQLPNSEGRTTNESLIESLSQAAHQLIANTKAAVISATAVAEEQQSSASINSSPFKAIRKAFSSQQVNQLDSNNITTTNNPSPDVHNRAHLMSIHHVEAHRALLYRVGLNIFNRTPEKGISYFIAHNFIENAPNVTNGSFYKSNQSGGHRFNGHDTQTTMINHHWSTSMKNCDGSSWTNCKECFIEENIKRNVADFLATRRGLSREKIGLYLGNLQENFNQEVLLYYLEAMDFCGLQVDMGLRKFLSGFRLPGEAQKIERLVEVFASRYVQSQAEHQQQLDSNSFKSSNLNKDNLIIREQDQANKLTTMKLSDIDNIDLKVPLLNKDEIFILSFAIIMLNTDLHSPSLKPQSRMSAQQFVNNLRGLFKSQLVRESELIAIYNRIKSNQISTLPDHMANLVHVQARLTVNNFQRKEMIPNLCQPHRRMVCYCRVYEVYDPHKKERGGQHQREIYLFNDLILICKIAKRIRANTEPPLVYRNSFPLQGLGVELFQSTHFDFGIRLYQMSTNSTLIMFNSVNKQDQVRFTRDLQDSIAEIHEMDEVKNKNIIDLLHLNFIEKLKKHSLMHQKLDQHQLELEDNLGQLENINRRNKRTVSNNQMIIDFVAEPPMTSKSLIDLREDSVELCDLDENQKINSYSNDNTDCNLTTPGASLASLVDQPRSTSSSGSSSNGSTTCNNKPSKAKPDDHQVKPSINVASLKNTGSVQRKCSASSVFSHDSGLFVMSRDVSPNQSS